MTAFYCYVMGCTSSRTAHVKMKSYREQSEMDTTMTDTRGEPDGEERYSQPEQRYQPRPPTVSTSVSLSTDDFSCRSVQSGRKSTEFNSDVNSKTNRSEETADI